MHSIQLVEPMWWKNLLQWGIDLQDLYPWISDIAPILADVFVLIYPAFLVCLYVFAILKKRKSVKQGCLYIFLVTFVAVLINIWIQCFFYKERPIVSLNQIETSETLLHEILPVSSFPSDHAVVSMTFAMAALVWWIYTRKRFFTWSGIFLLLVSFVMTSCRILTLVHRPSDIVAWLGLWVIVPLLFIIRPIRYAFLRYIINPIINFEQRILKKLFKYEQ